MTEHRKRKRRLQLVAKTGLRNRSNQFKPVLLLLLMTILEAVVAKECNVNIGDLIV
jgi:hypothetical protein